MPFEQARNAELYLIGGPFSWSLVSGATAFGYNHEEDTQRRGAGAFGASGPLGITQTYQGVSGSFDIEGVDGEDVVNAVATRQAISGFISGDLSQKYPFYIVSNVLDEDKETVLRSHLVFGAKLAGTPKNVAGQNAKTFNFQAIRANDFRSKLIQIDEFIGNATPVTSLDFTQTPYQHDGKYARLVLRQSENRKKVKVLQVGTDYTETETAITLTTGLGADEKALVLYLKQ